MIAPVELESKILDACEMGTECCHEIAGDERLSVRTMHGVAAAPLDRPPNIDALTSLRGLAALWVVLDHFQVDIVILLPISKVFSPLLNNGHFAVPLFFVLSGYVLTYNYAARIGLKLGLSEIARFWAHRLRRIYPLHLATLLATALMVFVARTVGLTISDTAYGGHDFLLNLLLIHAWVARFSLSWNYPSWSISAEWFAYLCFPLGCVALIRIRRLSTVVGLGLVFYGLSIGVILAGDRIPFHQVTAIIGPFSIGCILARAISLGYVPNFELKVATLILALALPLVPFLPDPVAIVFALVTIEIALVFTLAASAEKCSRGWRWKPLIILGDASYSLYMVHAIVQKILNEVVQSVRFADSSLTVRLILLMGYITAIFAVTWLAYHCVDLYFRKSFRLPCRLGRQSNLQNGVMIPQGAPRHP